VPRDSQSNDANAGDAPISPINAAGPATPAGHAGPGRMRVIADRLALRVTPDINAPMLRQLRAGTVVEILPQPQRAYWTAVKAGEQRGWVASQWLVPDESGQVNR
jgi:pilus assembly protein CpaC